MARGAQVVYDRTLKVRMTKEMDEFLDLLAARHNTSKADVVRQAIREHLGRGGTTLTDVYEAVQDLKRGNWTPALHAQPGNVEEHDEPPDVAAVFDSLGL